MRFKHNKPTPIGKERIIKIFLLFPKTIGRETRWFEYSEYKQIFTSAPMRTSKGKLYYYKYWKDTEWLN